MDKHIMSVINKQITRTMDNLVKNNMTAVFVENKDQVVAEVAEYIKEGEQVSVGGSMTLFETGIIDNLRSGRYNFLDRYMENMSRAQMDEIFRKSFFSDTY